MINPTLIRVTSDASPISPYATMLGPQVLVTEPFEARDLGEHDLVGWIGVLAYSASKNGETQASVSYSMVRDRSGIGAYLTRAQLSLAVTLAKARIALTS